MKRRESCSVRLNVLPELCPDNCDHLTFQMRKRYKRKEGSFEHFKCLELVLEGKRSFFLSFFFLTSYDFLITVTSASSKCIKGSKEKKCSFEPFMCLDLV